MSVHTEWIRRDPTFAGSHSRRWRSTSVLLCMGDSVMVSFSGLVFQLFTAHFFPSFSFSFFFFLDELYPLDRSRYLILWGLCPVLTYLGEILGGLFYSLACCSVVYCPFLRCFLFSERRLEVASRMKNEWFTKITILEIKLSWDWRITDFLGLPPLVASYDRRRLTSELFFLPLPTRPRTPNGVIFENTYLFLLFSLLSFEIVLIVSG